MGLWPSSSGVAPQFVER